MNISEIDMKKEFEFLKDRVLIIETSDDKTFTEDIKDALINIMTKPVVVNEIEGGHLAMMFDPDNYLKIINDFMNYQNEQYIEGKSNERFYRIIKKVV